MRELIILVIVNILVSVALGEIQFMDKDKQALTKFRTMIKFQLPNPYMYSDEYLFRWIRGSESDAMQLKIKQTSTGFSYQREKEYDLNKALHRLETNLKWRQEQHMDSILSENYSDLVKDYPYQFKIDNEKNALVFSLRFADWNLRKAQSNPRLFRLMLYIFENADKIYRDNKLDSVSWLVDAKGYSVEDHACEQCLKFFDFWTVTLENYYPHLLKHLIQVNAPTKDFNLVMDRVSNNLNPDREALKIFDNNKSNWVKEVSNLVGLDQIPKDYIEPAVKKPMNHPFIWWSTCAGCSVNGVSNIQLNLKKPSNL